MQYIALGLQAFTRQALDRWSEVCAALALCVLQLIYFCATGD